MIDIIGTERLIEQKIEEVLALDSIPKFKLIVYPGELEEYGKPINCATVIVKFGSIDYDTKPDNNFGNCMATEVNTINFNIKVHHHSLRNHRDVYLISTEVIRVLRGSQVLVVEDAQTDGTAPAYISSYSFERVTKGGGAYESNIRLSCQYTDQYRRKTQFCT